MTYWQRLQRSARRLKQIPYLETDRVEVWHIDTDDELQCKAIAGREEAQAFLAKYSSFVEVHRDYPLSGQITHISCVIIGKETIEEFWPDGPSMLEKTIEENAETTLAPGVNRVGR